MELSGSICFLVMSLIAVTPPGYGWTGTAAVKCSTNPGQYKSGWGDTACVACGAHVKATTNTALPVFTYGSETAIATANTTEQVSTSASECCKLIDGALKC